MSNRMKWVDNQHRLGLALLAVGIILGVIGFLLPAIIAEPGFNTRIVTGVGILSAGIGLAYLARSAAARRDPQAALRLASEARDERLQAIRAQAGNRAFWVSLALTYIVLMWLSFAGNGSLPPLEGDLLWFVMAGVVVVPLGVYVASQVIDQGRG